MKKIDESIMYLYRSYLIDEEKDNFVPDYNSLKKGILIDEKISEDIKRMAINYWGIDGYLLNQTFHKSLNKVISSSIEELVLEQLIHYISTYGFEQIGVYNKDNVYIPKEKLDIPELNENVKLINIMPITKEVLKQRLWDLIISSIPLSKKTIECIINLADYLELDENNIKKIINKEVKIALYDKLDILPQNNIEFLRYLIYKLTNITLLIKDSNTIQGLKQANKLETLRLIKTYEKLYSLVPLAEIFNRFKPLFLSLKTNKYIQVIDDEGVVLTKQYHLKREEIELNNLINRISKLSKKNHKPLVSNDLDNFINWYKDNYNKLNYIDLLTDKLKDAAIWRIIKLRNYIYLINSNVGERVYKIRNGRIWVTNKKCNIIINKETIDFLDNIIINKLKSNVFGKKIYLNKNENIILPQSEKQFVGNIPFSSSFEINKEDVLIGIHWYNVNENRVDLDLKLISNDYSVGWDANYKEDDKILFTGDMTDAPYPNGASEYIYISKLLQDTVFSIKVNNYTNNVDDIEYDIIIAKKSNNQLIKNYIVDPNDIIMKIPKNSIEKNKFEHSLGNIIIKNSTIKLVFSDLTTSNRRTSSNNDIEETLRKYLQQESNMKCSFNSYLIKAGAIIKDNKLDAELDLSIDNLNRNTILDLLK